MAMIYDLVSSRVGEKVILLFGMSMLEGEHVGASTLTRFYSISHRLG